MDQPNDSAKARKHPCPDCSSCQWCSERRCGMCRGWLARPAAAHSAAVRRDKDETRKDNDESE